MKYKIRYTKEFEKIIYAISREEAIYKFNREADDKSDIWDCELVK